MTPFATFRHLRKRHAVFHTVGVFVITLLVALQPVQADILRGGGAGASHAVTTPGVDPVATAQVVNAGRANASDILVRAADAAHTVQLMQDAARALAVSGPNHLAPTLPDVPNGLVSGGLVVDPGVAANTALWSGANQPTQTTSAGQTTVTVQQTSQQALLSWQTFNIGKNTTLAFDQSAGGANVGQWIAFNMINDPTGNPTQILGSIQAAGQVYVINQNGIIFGGSSQVNTHTLVASSLPINTNLISRGLLNNPDAQFLFSALALPAGTKGPTNGFTPPAVPAGGKLGDVTVQAGAQIEAPTTDASVGGRVVLVGPNVTNNGTISTPDGQTILAAGLQVGFAAHSSSDPSLRGLDVYVGAVVDPASLIPPYAGTTTNNGDIEAPRGDVTMTGKTVVQAGAIDSTTSVSLNGRIDLLARYNAITNTQYDPSKYINIPPFQVQSTGQVEIASGSVTQILPEWDSSATVTGTALALPSQINIQGLTVHMGADSIILAPNATVNVNAGVWQLADSPAQSIFVLSSGQIYLDDGAVINVAGSTDVNVPVTQNLITLQLRAAELANSPLQRDGVLRGQTITVDIRETGTYNGQTWVGTPLADVSGYVSLIQRTVGELTIAGGTVNLNAGGSAVVQNNAQINTSAGWINYTRGVVGTTKVITGGTIIDISQATPNLIYDGIYSAATTQNDLTWNVSTTFYQSTSPAATYYDPGLLHSGDGGQINITAPAMALDGSFLGSTFYGLDQLVNGPAASQFNLNFQAQALINGALSPLSPTPPVVTFQSGTTQNPVAAFSVDANGNPVAALSADRLANVYLAPELLTTSGFGSLTVDNAEGRIVVPVDAALTAGLHGTISLTGANLDIFGVLSAPGGTISLTALKISPQQVAAVHGADDLSVITPYAGRGLLTLGSSAWVTTAGTLTDDRQTAGTVQPQAYALSGGKVLLNAYNANLASGSILDVSGGLHMSGTGVAKFGNAGTLTIQAGHDYQLPYFLGGQFTQFGATLLGYSGAVGGTLSVSAPLVQVGGTALSADALVLQPSFFQQGGFTNFKISGTGESAAVPGQYLPGVSIASGTVIQPVTDSLALAPGTTLGTTIAQPHEYRIRRAWFFWCARQSRCLWAGGAWRNRFGFRRGHQHGPTGECDADCADCRGAGIHHHARRQHHH